MSHQRISIDAFDTISQSIDTTAYHVEFKMNKLKIQEEAARSRSGTPPASVSSHDESSASRRRQKSKTSLKKTTNCKGQMSGTSIGEANCSPVIQSMNVNRSEPPSSISSFASSMSTSGSSASSSSASDAQKSNRKTCNQKKSRIYRSLDGKKLVLMTSFKSTAPFDDAEVAAIENQTQQNNERGGNYKCRTFGTPSSNFFI